MGIENKVVVVNAIPSQVFIVLLLYFYMLICSCLLF